jgi:hypothetical protein
MSTIRPSTALPATVLIAVLVAACSGSGGAASASASVAASTAPSVAPSASGAAPSASSSASAAPSASGSGDLASKIPAQVGDLAMGTHPIDAQTYITLNASKQLAKVLTTLGKTAADVTVVTGTGSTETAVLFLDAVQIAGADQAALAKAFQDAALADKSLGAKAATVNGKDVVMWTTTAGTTAVYPSGDTLFFVTSSDPDLVSQALAALP